MFWRRENKAKKIVRKTWHRLYKKVRRKIKGEFSIWHPHTWA
jgi:hypothetical protein